MALNPFFLQGSSSEQRLVQQLINEQLKIYGIDVTYIPRKFVRKDNIFQEIQSSKFDDNFTIEAYVNTYEGYSGAGDLMTKFGVSIKDELVVTISKERFEDFISPFLEGMDDDEIVLSTRPREGDLVYFPLGQRIFEVKFVEHEQPFYQLGKTYVYELKCELFEYEDEVVDTSVEEIDTQLEEEGFITTLKLIGVGATASVSPVINTGYIRNIFLNNDGSGYTSTPTVSISTAPSGGTDATAVAITTNKAGIYSIKEILLINAGAGYTVPPIITITGGGGVGASATCGIETVRKGVTFYSIDNAGQGYAVAPTITFTKPKHVGAAATAIIDSPIGAGVSVLSAVVSIGASNYLFPGGTTGGVYYKSIPTVTFSLPTGTGESAAATAVMGDYASTGGTVSSVVITPGSEGKYYGAAPSISISHPGFSYAAATIDNGGGIDGSSIDPASIAFSTTGRAYKTAPTVAISTGGAFGTSAPTIVAVGIATIHPITGIVTAVGFDQSLPWCVGTGATVGSGYTTAPQITFSGATAAKSATATATVSIAGTISQITMTDFGYGYADGTTATVTISGSSGAGESFRATGIATMRFSSVKTEGTLAIGSTTITGINTSNIIVGDRVRLAIGHSDSYNFIPTDTYVAGIGFGQLNISNIPTNVGIATSTFEFGIDQCGIVTGIIVTFGGGGYLSPPTITITNNPSEKNYIDLVSGITTALGRTGVNTSGSVNIVYITDPGEGYVLLPDVSVSSPPIITGIGTFEFNEVVTGSTTGTIGRVKDWDSTSNTLKVSIVNGSFANGEVIVGSSSSATYSVKSYDGTDPYDKYSQNDEIEEEADLILDFSQSNPFGNY